MELRDVGGPLGVERLTPSPHTSVAVDTASTDGGLVSKWQFAGAYYVVIDHTLGQGKVAE